jgi:hypothetical protein
VVFERRFMGFDELHSRLVENIAFDADKLNDRVLSPRVSRRSLSGSLSIAGQLAAAADI